MIDWLTRRLLLSAFRQVVGRNCDYGTYHRLADLRSDSRLAKCPEFQLSDRLFELEYTLPGETRHIRCNIVDCCDWV
jgi:hypothetical protein